MKQDFLNYIKDTFNFDQNEMEEFESALSKPLKKTLRVNTNKISIWDFQEYTERKWWTLSPTPLGKNMFYVDREDTTLALWHTLEHITGYFYVQELAASSSPFYMSDDQIDDNDYTILDMSASPGWKTTQLTEYYPNATIVANEIDKNRMRQLHENLDRLGAKNVFVTNYDGRYFKNFPETFDKILLDAPCSGEGTAYKTDDALKYWNIKNIKRIAKLQFQLLEAAFIALKVWGELVYSTCTLNRLENEEIINKLTDKYGDYFNIISLDEEMKHPLVRSWPHKNNTGWFFVARLVKKDSPEYKVNESKIKKASQGFSKVSNTDEKIITSFLQDTFNLSLPGRYYSYLDEIYYAEKNIDFFWENFFLFKTGIKIGKLENGSFTPNFFLWTHFWILTKNVIEVDSQTLHRLYKGEEVQIDEQQNEFIQISFENIPAGIVRYKDGQIKSLLESRFMRK